ncbi:hypothetical protein F4780DRAFT_778579 [Xylariomycetidae sp. FL0641]|nr:hypothetical protein F4780DRAFT_778579 [Xylariomycetidae sp. FL0641]
MHLSKCCASLVLLGAGIARAIQLPPDLVDGVYEAWEDEEGQTVVEAVADREYDLSTRPAPEPALAPRQNLPAAANASTGAAAAAAAAAMMMNPWRPYESEHRDRLGVPREDATWCFGTKIYDFHSLEIAMHTLLDECVWPTRRHHHQQTVRVVTVNNIIAYMCHWGRHHKKITCDPDQVKALSWIKPCVYGPRLIPRPEGPEPSNPHGGAVPPNQDYLTGRYVMASRVDFVNKKAFGFDVYNQTEHLCHRKNW